MAIGAGLGGQVGFAPESTYGTFVAPSNFIEVESAPFEFAPEFTETSGIAAGRTGMLASRRQATTRQGSGSLEAEVTTKGFGALFQQLMGTTVTPAQQGATTAYLQTHTLNGDAAGKSLSIQLGIPRTTGVVDAYTYVGAKCIKGTFSAGVGETLKANLEFDVRDMVSQTLGAAAISATALPFHWGQSVLKVGATYGAEAAVDGVSEVEVEVARAVKDDRFYMGGGGVKAEPITNDLIEVSGSLTVDYLDKATFVDRFMSNTGFSLVWEFTGAVIQGAYSEKLRFKFPKVFLDGGVPQLEGLDVVSGEFPFKAYLDGANPHAVIEYISTDVTL